MPENFKLSTPYLILTYLIMLILYAYVTGIIAVVVSWLFGEHAGRAIFAVSFGYCAVQATILAWKEWRSKNGYIKV